MSIGHGTRLGELDREEGERVAGDDAVELGRLLGFAHREERLHASGRANGLDPDVVTAVDQRDRERRGFGTRLLEFAPDAFRSKLRRAGGRCQWLPVEIEEKGPPFGDRGQRLRDALDTFALEDRARKDVLGVDRSLEGLELLGQDAREDGLGDGDERNGEGHLEQREVELRGCGDERLRHLLEREAQSDAQARHARLGEALDVGALFGGVAPTPMPVVRISSPPLSHGVGSSSSDAWTHLMGRVACEPPARSFNGIPGIAVMSLTVTAMDRLYGTYSLLPWLGPHAHPRWPLRTKLNATHGPDIS